MATDASLGEAVTSAGMYGGDVIARDFADWTPELKAEFEHNTRNYKVGGKLLSETDRVKVWEIRLAPGERLPAHRHVLDYFWTVLTSGESLQHNADGTTRRVAYKAGETRHATISVNASGRAISEMLRPSINAG